MKNNDDNSKINDTTRKIQINEDPLENIHNREHDKDTILNDENEQYQDEILIDDYYDLNNECNEGDQDIDRSKKFIDNFGIIYEVDDDTFYQNIVYGRDDEEQVQEHEEYSLSQYDYQLGHKTLGDKARNDIIQQIHRVSEETKILRLKNGHLQKLSIDILRASQRKSVFGKFDEATVFEDPRYKKALERYVETRDIFDEKNAEINKKLQSLQMKYSDLEKNFSENFNKFIDKQLEETLQTTIQNADRENLKKKLEIKLAKQHNGVIESKKARLEFVRLLSRLDKLQTQLKQYDSCGPGFSIIDFEQLLKKKNILTEKLEEQEESIKIYKEKTVSTATIVAHVAQVIETCGLEISKENEIYEKNQNLCEDEKSKLTELLKQRIELNKKIIKSRGEIGLLDHPYLLKKMELDMQKIQQLEKEVSLLEKESESRKKEIADLSKRLQILQSQ